MPGLKVAKLGNPILRRVAEAVDVGELSRPESGVQKLIDDMVETMREEGGVGLAAPQVSQSLRIVVLEYNQNSRYPGNPAIPLTVLVNPVITRYSEATQLGWESCLSLADFRGLVPRSREIAVEALDRNGEPLVLEARDFHAVVLQHEIDHLNGLVFIDRMKDLTKLTYQEEFETYWLNQEVAAI